MRILLRLLPLLLLLSACASNSTTNKRSPAGRSDLITREQIWNSGYKNAFEAVQTLRSNWLNTRGIDSFSTPGQVQVYVNDIRVGGVEALRSIPTIDISFIRHYDGIAASGRWGLDHGHGVIFISTRPE